VDAAERALGMPETLDEGRDVLEPELDADRFETEQVLKRILQVRSLSQIA
jgi:hypothetical protein